MRTESKEDVTKQRQRWRRTSHMQNAHKEVERRIVNERCAGVRQRGEENDKGRVGGGRI